MRSCARPGGRSAGATTRPTTSGGSPVEGGEPPRTVLLSPDLRRWDKGPAGDSSVVRTPGG